MAEHSDPRLSLALRLAREAGRHAVARAGGARVESKGPGDRVTDVDLASQARIAAEVGTWFPGDGLVAEEGARGAGLDREFVWVLDPLDGTNNYALGIPCFAVSIGILRAGAPWAGVVHDPNTGFTCWSLHGQGAFAGDRRLTVHGRALSAASNVAVRVPVDPVLGPVVGEWMERYKFRGFGSVALHLAYAALGALDLVLDHRAALWDLAAGAAVVIEAGGALTDPAGEPLFPFPVASYRGAPVPFLAGNPEAHAQGVAACRARLWCGAAGEGRP